jgi:hypothetical protein
MNCPECDALLFHETCACGFSIPPISTIEIKRMGAEVANYLPIISGEAQGLLEEFKRSGRPQGFWLKNCLNIIKRGNKC